MATVNLYLKGALSESTIKSLASNDKHLLKELLVKPLQIYLKVSMGGKRLQIYTKKRISQNLWNKDKQEANCRRMKDGCVELNTWLTDFKRKVEKSCSEFELEGKGITKPELTLILEKKILSKKYAHNFIDLKDVFLKNQTTSSGTKLKSGSIKKYESLITHLNNFCKDKYINPDFTNVDIPFLLKFKEYLTVDQDLSDNTSSKYLKMCKTYFGYFIKNGYLKPLDFSDLKTPEKEGNIIVLELKQILHLQNKKIESLELQEARDVFCFMCWTGQRYSDIEKIKREDIYTEKGGQKVWDLIVEKTGERIIIPIITYADKILEKFKNDPYPLPRITNQRMNQYLKTIGRIAEFHQTIKIIKYYNDNKQEFYEPLRQHLTTHVARKSYITNSLILGIPERIVREVSGHKDEKSFRRYVNLAKSYKNQVIQDAYSKGNLSKYI